MGVGFCSINACSDVEDQQFSTMESHQKRDVDIKDLAELDFVQVSNSNEYDNKQMSYAPQLFAISEDKSVNVDENNENKLKTSSDAKQLETLRIKYSSRKIILPEKDKSRTPLCVDCNGFYHIQSDPISAYQGVGIICELCGKNRTDNPELLLENHYYKCEQCENVDICSKCYEKEKQKLIKTNNLSKK
eukprot:443930_1